MRETYKSYTFTHSDSNNVSVVNAAYELALEIVKTDKGTPFNVISYKKGSDYLVTIIYKKSILL